MVNNSFQKVFTEESEFEEQVIMTEGRRGLESIQTSTPEIRKLLEKLDARKAAGPYEVSSWIIFFFFFFFFSFFASARRWRGEVSL